MDNIRIFRLEGAADTSLLDFIDFNNNTRGKSTKIPNAFIRSINKLTVEGVGDNQSAEQDSGDKQALGEVDQKWVITGFISQRNNSAGSNPFLVQMDLWDADTKQNDNWPEGQFGIVDDGCHLNDLIPSRTGLNQIGLLWESLERKSDLLHNQEEFILTFTVSKGDGS